MRERLQPRYRKVARRGFTLRQLVILTAFAAFIFALIRGCYIDAIKAAQVRPGMNKSEVLAIMGRPAEEISTAGGEDEWCYKRVGAFWYERVIAFDQKEQVIRMYERRRSD